MATEVSGPSLGIGVDEANKRSWDGLLTAGLNVRYHRYVALYDGRAERLLKIAVAISSSSAFVTSPVFDNPIGEIGWWIVSLSAAFCGIVLATFQFKTWEEEHRELVEQWAEVQARWEQVRVRILAIQRHEVGEIDPAEFIEIERQQGLLERRQKRAPIKYLLARCYRQECESRGV